MVKYYSLNLNCARVRDKEPFTNDYGFIEALPVKGTEVKQGFFGPKKVVKTEYTGECYVIAIFKNDHFTEVIRGKNVEYDSEGLRDITTATMEDLENNLSYGLTCNSFTEVDQEVAFFYINKIIDDPKALEKYTLELDELEKKENVEQEILRRKNSADIEDVNHPVRSLKREMKSA